jgi:tRNA(fMet)-specific endonuclease VapC
LDTSVVVAHFRGDTACSARLAECEAVYLPATALGELYHGAYKSPYTAKHLEQIEKFLNGVFVLEADGVTARHYGQVRSELARAGTLIPENDIWIGAVAKQYGLSLATRDAHFEAVSGIALLQW